MPYAPEQIQAVADAASALSTACSAEPADDAAIDAAVTDAKSAMDALKGEDDADMSGIGDKSPEERVSLKAKLAKAAFGE